MLYLDPGRSSQLHPDHRPGRAGCTCTGTRWRRRAISCPGCIIDDFDHDDQLAVAVAAAARGRRTPAASLYVAPHSEGQQRRPERDPDHRFFLAGISAASSAILGTVDFLGGAKLLQRSWELGARNAATARRRDGRKAHGQSREEDEDDRRCLPL